MSNYSKEDDMAMDDYIHEIMDEAEWKTYKQALTETLVVIVKGMPKELEEEMDAEHYIHHATVVAKWLASKLNEDEFQVCQQMAEGIVDGYISNKEPPLPPNKNPNKEKFLITCPRCSETTLVYHLNWISAGCPHCDMDVDLVDWKIKQAHE